MSGCVFCEIAAGTMPAAKVYEDEHCLAFMDIHPIRPGHLLVIPRGHAEQLLELPQATRDHLFRVGQRLMNAIRHSALDSDAFNLAMNDGRAAGQSVPHVHLHILPRRRGDMLATLRGLLLHFTGLFGRAVAHERLEQQAAVIRDALTAVEAR